GSLLARGRPGPAPRDGQGPYRGIGGHHGHSRVRAIAAGQEVAGADRQFRRWARNVGNVDDLAIENSGASHVLASERDRKPASKRFDAGGVGGGGRRRLHFISIPGQGDDRTTRKQLQPALDDRIEHRLSVIERIADDAEYPRGRRLLLQRLSKIVRALAQFVEQAAVLDSDDRLIGEARDQLDLLVSEGTNVLAVN